MTFASILIAYLLGSIPFGYVLTRLRTGQDVRASGSGNIGATNVMRTAGRGLGIATLLLDAGKGTLAVWLADCASSGSTTGSTTWMALAALAVMLGHVFPIFLNFKGGKAVATFAGAFGYLLPMPLLATVVVFAMVLALTHYVSAASIVAAATFPIGAWIISRPSTTEMLVAIFAGALVVYRHSSNMARIRAGTEGTFPSKR
ncbi:MAG: glycerol-3-phosphate 1-O-acyltransferase PlsY [Acidobacteriota bacterium]